MASNSGRSEVHSESVPNDVSPQSVTEHFVACSVPVLFVSPCGLQLRKFHSLLPSGRATYATQFCDLERWSSQLKLVSVGLTADYCSSSDTSDSNGSNSRAPNANMVRRVEASESHTIDKAYVAKGTG
ncbi:Dwil\GK11829-PA-like protein [Anopheles sinensis]|uniref:Dwil\GK11829-PA-like protein n=1 Tax=Anopheles sinensis TaxID=74873 RepID=A0A084WP09_ANOSI|nr:Dwil\GK11829-PA-like protein [Anopheles sinensis]